MFCQSCNGICIKDLNRGRGFRSSKYNCRGEKLRKHVLGNSPISVIEEKLNKNPHLLFYHAWIYSRNILQHAIFQRNYKLIKFIIKYAKEKLTEDLYNYFITSPGGFNSSYYAYPIQALDIKLIQFLIKCKIPLDQNVIHNTLWGGNKKYSLKDSSKSSENIMKLLFKYNACIHNETWSIDDCFTTFKVILNFNILYNIRSNMLKMLVKNKLNIDIISLTEFLSAEYNHFSNHSIFTQSIFLNNIETIFTLYFGNYFFKKISNYFMQNLIILFQKSSYANNIIKQFTLNLINSHSFIMCRKQFDHKIFSIEYLNKQIITYL